MPAGRPTKYNGEVVQQALDYLEEFNTKHGHAIPSVIGMAKVLKLDDTTLYDWAKKDGNEFSRILPRCKKYQEFQLINGGLMGELNSNIVKLALGKHGYSEKKEIDLNDNSQLSDDELARKLAESRQKNKQSLTH
tara:strand:- start:172 stop:576 length:405 start_codon:yes stop_codon:yes gene_type:complete